jgi:murein DD-endopeptidase MepM/ murein hydrolase activator NlpD
VKFKIQDSNFKFQKGQAFSSSFILLPFFLVLTACATATVSSDNGLSATQFVETRVAEILTQSAVNPSTPTAVPSSTLAATETRRVAPLASATPVPTIRLLPTGGATITPPATPPPSPTLALACAEADVSCVHDAEHFWLERPIPADYNFLVERTYPYASTQGDLREPHHGVEFENRSGTPVIAVAPGTVVVAGDDALIAYGPALSFYGNLVVIQLTEPYRGQPVFVLYGHLSQVAVRVGQAVQTGDKLGEVGFTGIAIGPHLHFEVRVGANDYASTRNPELWLKPLPYNGQPWGVIAGRVVDTNGNLLFNLTVAIRPIQIDYEVQRNRFITTYVGDGVNGDEALQENFAIGDMPLGIYRVSVNTTKPYEQTITVEAGRISWVTFVVNPPYPTVTPTP